jgi:proteasome accessory factor C
LFQPAPEHRSAVLTLEPEAHWVAEYYLVDDIVDEPDSDAIRVVMRYTDPAWLVRLVLGLGGGARVVEPPELAVAVARRARAALAMSDGRG